MLERLVVQGDDYVALVNARRRTRSLRIDTHHHGARAAAPLDRNRLEPEAQIPACDTPMCFELRRNPLNGRSRNDEHPPTRAEYSHPDRLPARIEGETPFRAPPQSNVKLDPRIDLAAAQRTPGRPSS
jgi:hypothetical protein